MSRNGPIRAAFAVVVMGATLAGGLAGCKEEQAAEPKKAEHPAQVKPKAEHPAQQQPAPAKPKDHPAH